MKATLGTCLAACSLLAGCALVQPPPKPAPAQPGPRELLAHLTLGESTKADALALLGEGVVVDFPSGYEVWVYREPEVVLLFEPSGILTNSRIR